MSYQSLRDFLQKLEKDGNLVRVSEPVSTDLEITEIHNRLLKNNAEAVLFENVVHEGEPSSMPVLANLFGSIERVAQGMGGTTETLQAIGKKLAFLKEPTPPTNLKEAISLLPMLKTLWAMKPKTVKKAACHEVVLTGDEVDLSQLPIQTCWPGEPAPLITWGLVVTQGPNPKQNAQDHFNLGIYRMQVLGRNKTLMRWLKHRGGAQHHARWKGKKPEPMPAAVVIGADPATILAAVTPVPDTLSEYQFAGMLRGRKTKLVNCKTIPLKVPASAEIVLEGYVSLDEYGDEGPYGDHTGYYNSVEQFPTFTITAITMRKDPIYLTTFTGRPPDEPSVLGEALNEVFIPLIRQQFPEIDDFWLPPEGCSYRIAVISIKKAYAGHAKRIQMGVWSYLRQFIYTKFVIIVDSGVNCRNWDEVLQAMLKHCTLSRGITLIENTPIDYLDFASPISGLGGKLGIDATQAMGGELELKNNEHEITPHQIAPNAPKIVEVNILRYQTSESIIIAAIDKSEPHQAAHAMQVLYQKYIQEAAPKLMIIVDTDINVHNLKDVFWAVSTRMDPVKNTIKQAHYLGWDATNKIGNETDREWGKEMVMDSGIINRVDGEWDKYGFKTTP